MRDITEIKKLGVGNSLTPAELVAWTMRQCGSTYQEIGDVLGVTRQAAKQNIERLEKKLS